MRSSPRSAAPVATLGVVARGIIAVLAVAATCALGAAPAHGATTIEVRGGAGDGYWPGHHVPLIVTVRADRLVRGTIRVTPDQVDRCCGPGWSMAVDIPIEVAGGSTKDVVAVVDAPSAQRGEPEQAFSAQVELVDGETVVGAQRVNLKAADWEETVGVLPKLAAAGQLPKHAPLRFNSGTANLVAVDPLVLDAGRDALGPFAAIIGAPNDLDGLAPAQRRAVLDWVAAGGHLLVDAAPGPVAGLPDDWQPGAGSWAIAGAGDVRLTAGQAAEGHWANLLDPTAAGAISQASPNQIPFNADPSTSLSSSLGADAGFALPSLPFLVGALVVYVVVAGPVTFIVLARRKQRPLAWVVVPAIAVAFTLLFAAVGTVLRNDADIAHGTVIDIGPAGARATTAALVGSVNGGRTTVQMPDGWTTDSAPPTSFGPVSLDQASPAALTIGATGVEASVDLDPGEFSLLRATGPVDGYDRGLVVTASTNGTTVEGTIRNDLSVALHEVTVLVHQTATDIGTVGPGEEKHYEVQAPLTTGNGAMPELSRWPVSPRDRSQNGDFGMTVGVACAPQGPCGPPPTRPSDVETDVNTPMWMDFAIAQQTSLRALGAVSVAGWTEELPSALRVGSGDVITKGRTAVVAHATIDVHSFDTVGARIEEVRDTDLRKDVTDVRDLQVNGKLYRIVLPSKVDGKPIDPASVVIRPPTGFHAIAVPGASAWNNTPVHTDRIEYHVRPEDVVAGVVYVRTRIGDQFDESPNVELSAPAKGWQISIGPVRPGSGIDVSEAANNQNGGFVGGAPVPVTTATLAPIVPPPDPAAVPGDASVPTSVQPPLPGDGSTEAPPATTGPTFAPPGPVTGGGR